MSGGKVEREDLYDLIHHVPLKRAEWLVSRVVSYRVRIRAYTLIPGGNIEEVFEVAERGVIREVPRRLWRGGTASFPPSKIDDAHSVIWGQVIRDA